MTDPSKIKLSHTQRTAYVYVRQSTPDQVEHNPESTTDSPRSSSMMTTCSLAQPSWRALSAKAYCRVAKTNKWPAKASSSKCSRTSACRPSKLLRFCAAAQKRNYAPSIDMRSLP